MQEIFLTRNIMCNIPFSNFIVYLPNEWHNSKCIIFYGKGFWKFHFLAITEESKIYLIISIISKQCMES